MPKYVMFNGGWWELVGNRLFNRAGGWCPASLADIAKAVEAPDMESLDYNGTDVLNSKFITGWIDRNGVHYGCFYMCHIAQAEYVHHSSEPELEERGWVKVYQSNWGRHCSNGYEFIIMRYKVSEAQIATLKRLGFTDEEIERDGRGIE